MRDGGYRANCLLAGTHPLLIMTVEGAVEHTFRVREEGLEGDLGTG